ncbi:transcriptional repressor LexA [Gluconacetobacter azotocaptans]|uniref:LexA repressor n=1 Tax=Gluconacetobacter azotocaptans TaxID=142834 RepID=A0A7W4JU59_9PROT|nr:transcriptional repressor LexA [Gluconacetobacter azotocaptans]MBB2190914.1 transcriptional repressor LexA [Gluconacetobacter azotocaptans]MBM9401729.1 transcriptional repressor LexA [Gluconacetobacter azotocaptans]GBQ31731.1 LexA repressor [Gluconacetobacter azotocaptans DSM 13594]
MLTRKQHELLLFIDRHLKQTGFSPSFDEMKDALNLRSKSGIHRLISALEERDFLKRRHHRARALEVLRLPEIAPPPQEDPPAPLPAEAFVPNVIKGDFAGRLTGAHVATEAGAINLPFYGRIAAGQPIEAMRDTGAQIEVPLTLLSQGDHYALEVAGDSMIEAGILDGDTVIIRQSDTADNGQIVVALIDDLEVTLKRLRRRGSTIALEPANARYESRIVPSDRVRIQGLLVGLLRQY